MSLTGGSALYFLQCSDTVGWVTGRTSGPQKDATSLIPNSSLPERVEELSGNQLTQVPGKRPLTH